MMKRNTRMRDYSYKKTPKGRYDKQREHAVKRGIPWDITFEEWINIWEESGKWNDRGVGKGKYCMCRVGDSGSYSSDNVYIGLFTDNVKDQHKFNPCLKDNLRSDAAWKLTPDEYRNVGILRKEMNVQEVADLYMVSTGTIYTVLKLLREDEY